MDGTGKEYFGLTEKEVEKSREKYGRNALQRRKRKGFFKQYLSAFSDPIIRILLVTLAINAAFFFKSRNITETVGIAIAVFLSTFVSTLSEYGSESAFERLLEESEKTSCRVRREGRTQTVKTSDLVRGDILLLEAGERIPADGTVLFGKLMVSQSPLSGESAEIEKTPEVKRGEKGFLRREKVFDGSLVTAGEAIVRVDEVGEATFYGKIASELQEDKTDSPLKRKLTKLARTLSKIGYVAAVLVALADLINAFFIDNGMNFALAKADFCDPATLFSNLTHALTLAIAVVVVAVPEGLPMMIAVVLSSNRAKMAKDNVLVKRAAGIEAAGSMQILFTDKTGTLTKGAPSVAKIVTGDGKERKIDALESDLFVSLAACAHFNGGGAVDFSTGECTLSLGGNASDRALRAALPFQKQPFEEKFGKTRVISREKFTTERKYACVRLQSEKSPFFKTGGEESSEHGENSVWRNGKNGQKREITFLQGAPETLLRKCDAYCDGAEIQPLDCTAIEENLHSYTRAGWRVLALAYRESAIAKGESDSTEKNAIVRSSTDSERYVFLAFALLRDGLRKEAKKAVRDLTRAGVQVVVVTGDHAETAEAIAKEVGLLSPISGEAPVVLTGTELADLSDEEALSILPRLRVVARAVPTDKSRLVALAKKSGRVVGMTGDGINDAAALKKADVGFALGSGTDVAKEAGDVVISDDDLSSVVKAVSYGRRVFKSIRQFVVFQLTMNLCAVGISLFAPFFGIDTPVTVMQMLWINVIMDTLASLAFAGIKADERDMLRPPVPFDESVLTARLAGRVVATGAYCVFLCLAFLRSQKIYSLFSADTSRGNARFYTAFFSLFVFSGLFGAFHARTDSPNPFSHVRGGGSFFAFIAITSVFQIGLLYFGGSVFRTAGMSFSQLMLSVGLAATVLPVGAIVKRMEKAFVGRGKSLFPKRRRRDYAFFRRAKKSRNETGISRA